MLKLSPVYYAEGLIDNKWKTAMSDTEERAKALLLAQRQTDWNTPTTFVYPIYQMTITQFLKETIAWRTRPLGSVLSVEDIDKTFSLRFDRFYVVNGTISERAVPHGEPRRLTLWTWTMVGGWLGFHWAYYWGRLLTKGTRLDYGLSEDCD